MDAIYNVRRNFVIYFWPGDRYVCFRARARISWRYAPTHLQPTRSSFMRAIVIKQHGGPEVLAIEQRPDPTPTRDQVLIDVKAFGLNHAEVYFRSGAWGEVA